MIIPRSKDIASIILEDTMNEKSLVLRVLAGPNIKPHIIVNRAKLTLFPTSLFVDSIAEALLKSFSLTCVNTSRLFGDENIPCPIP